ncbi:MAG: uridine diphosphate-N-acetylglucosamine-binding protein YvcK [Actinomycetes bacterium]
MTDPRIALLAPDGPRVVALGGGRGLAMTLRAVRRYAGSVTAVVSVADDGGSSGRLRRDLGVPAPGDLRKCLEALAAGPTPIAAAFDHRFAAGDLAGHPLGNLLIVGLAETFGDLRLALDECGRLLGTVGRVLPATVGPVGLRARVAGGAEVEGQVAVQEVEGRIRQVAITPEDAAVCPEAVEAILGADQIVLAPGSLYTSVAAVLAVPGIRSALGEATGRVVHVANLSEQVPETAGYDGVDHLRALFDHGARIDTFLYARDGSLVVDEDGIRALGVRPVGTELAGSDRTGHDAGRMAEALRDLL